MSASNAIMQFIGNVCAIAGNREERQRCHDYIGWILLTFVNGSNISIDTANRSDVTEVSVPREKTYLLSFSTLRDFEVESGTFMILADGSEDTRLLICGYEEVSALGGRMKAEASVRKLLSGQARSNDSNWNRSSRDDSKTHSSYKAVDDSRHWKSESQSAWTSRADKSGKQADERSNLRASGPGSGKPSDYERTWSGSESWSGAWAGAKSERITSAGSDSWKGGRADDGHRKSTSGDRDSWSGGRDDDRDWRSISGGGVTRNGGSADGNTWRSTASADRSWTRGARNDDRRTGGTQHVAEQRAVGRRDRSRSPRTPPWRRK